MTAKKQALLGVIGGAIVVGALIVCQYPDRNAIGHALAVGIPMGMFYGFGYAFSWNVLKKWLSWAAGASSTVAIGAIWSQLLFRRGLFLGLFISVFLIIGALGLAYIPGLFIGIRRLWVEARAH